MNNQIHSRIALTLALVFPWLLKLFFLGNTGQLPLLVGYFFFAIAILTPWYAIYAAITQRTATSTSEQVRDSRYLLLLSLIPSAYCLIGVTLYMFQANHLELPLYYLSILLVVLWRRRSPSVKEIRSSKAGFIRVAHGVTALLLLIFISLHLFNHLSANISPETHLAVMEELRNYYRHPVIEPLLIALCLFQLGSGIWLARHYMVQPTDAFNTAQVGTGLMLMVFLSSHLLAVLVLGRLYVGVDTNWNWLVYQPGLLKDAWNVRLVSHYITGVAALLMHLGLALRFIFKSHGWHKAAQIVFILGILATLVLTYAIMRPLLLASS